MNNTARIFVPIKRTSSNLFDERKVAAVIISRTTTEKIKRQIRKCNIRNNPDATRKMSVPI